ncbi:glycerol-3-phosphate transporter permease [Amylibacter marinus]|uniref:sn-glycerol-3-phosphate transport system permease protein UgpA n=1 Tax=Amylibacter marinus TaxID=1475483 RepID=A0ABQ5VYI0_9RHOB|nr:ABC transporter permease subunit [Amylibacter marinus]GLQ36257.1 glycerol-3-phosphate transporter permease [Amylibacter marinus]
MKRAAFTHPWMPVLLLIPQLTIIVFFFYWPAVEALRSSFYLQDPFGFGGTFVGLENYFTLFQNKEYLRISLFTVIFTLSVTFFSLAFGLVFAVKADKVLRGASTYKTMLMWVYAVAPPVAGLLGVSLFYQGHGLITQIFALFGYEFVVGVNYKDTAFAMIAVSIWKQVPINFIFFLSGLQSVPRSIREAAMIENGSPFNRFWTITFPLLAPTAFFLLITNITYSLFDTFGVIDVMLRSEPGNNPMTLTYKVYVDGFRGNELGGSSAQSVILMVLVLALTVFQFRLIERRIHYT